MATGGARMLGLLKLLIFGFAFLTLVYLAVSVYARSARAQELRREWEERGGPGDRDAYVDEGMAQYRRSLARRLILLVYVVPVAAVGVIVYITNFA